MSDNSTLKHMYFNIQVQLSHNHPICKNFHFTPRAFQMTGAKIKGRDENSQTNLQPLKPPETKYLVIWFENSHFCSEAQVDVRPR